MILMGDYFRTAVREARRRHLFHLRNHTEHKHRRADRSFEHELDSIGAEAAAAQHLGRPYEPHDDIARDRAEGDLGDGLQVRHTRWPNGHLMLHDTDLDEHTFYLVTGAFPEFEVRGSLLAEEGKDEKWWDTDMRSPCYMVPQERLDAV